ncbi:RNA-directed DNA polymerase, eukaryota, reverse transcriptase zinc-binding domain protein [Tanacetum coccineum]
MDAGMFKGIMLDSSTQLSHMFYADDAIFVGQWSEMNMNTIVHVLDCFYRASGLRINMSKSKIIGIAVDEHKVEQAAEKIRCSILKAPFFYLGSKKSIWVKWKNVLASKEKGGLGVSSLYALNRALMFKWIWRFMTHKSSLWARVIKAIHGNDGNIGKSLKCGHMSIWRDIVQEMETLKAQDNVAFKYKYPRLYALEVDKSIDVATKLSHSSMAYSFRREPRSGVEQSKMVDLLLKIEGVSLVPMNDKWVWSLEDSVDQSGAHQGKCAWKVRLDCLPTRLNISRRGIDIDSILCPICGNAVESSRHLFFECQDVKEIFRKICKWWDVSYREMALYED